MASQPTGVMTPATVSGIQTGATKLNTTKNMQSTFGQEHAHLPALESMQRAIRARCDPVPYEFLEL